MSEPRPLGAGIASALLAVVALAGAIGGPYLIVLGVVVSDDIVGDGSTLVLATETLVGAGCIALAVVALLAARAMWRGRSWAWPAALFVGVALVVATAVVYIEAEWSNLYALIAVLGGALVLTLLPVSVRRAYGLAPAA